MENVEIKRIQELREDSVNQLYNLLNQLTPGLQRKKFERGLEDTISNQNETLLAAKIGDRFVGMLVMIRYFLPEGVYKAVIEDVIVDENSRGNGVGRLLIMDAINRAKKNGDTQINLTSKPSRISANKLYQSLGFQMYETNHYRLKLK